MKADNARPTARNDGNFGFCFPKLSQASKEQLENWELPGDGEGIHWPDVDEDLSVAGLLIGTH